MINEQTFLNAKIKREGEIVKKLENNSKLGQKLETAKLVNDKAVIKGNLEIATQQRKVAASQIKAKKEADIVENTRDNMRLTTLKAQFETVKLFSKAVGRDTPFVKSIEALMGLKHFGGSPTLQSKFSGDLGTAQNQLTAATAIANKTDFSAMDQTIKDTKILRQKQRAAEDRVAEEKLTVAYRRTQAEGKILKGVMGLMKEKHALETSIQLLEKSGNKKKLEGDLVLLNEN